MEHLPNDLADMVRRLNAEGHLPSELRRVRGREEVDYADPHDQPVEGQQVVTLAREVS